MKTIQELVPLIQEWAKEREIFDQSTPFDQLLKTHEEVGELIKACYDNDKPAIQDAIGDTMVCLINYCYFKNMDFIFHYEKVYPMEAPYNITQTTFAISANNILSELFEAEYEQDELYLYSYLIEHILIRSPMYRLIRRHNLRSLSEHRLQRNQKQNRKND